MHSTSELVCLCSVGMCIFIYETAKASSVTLHAYYYNNARCNHVTKGEDTDTLRHLN